MFRLYDLNMNPIDFPAVIRPLHISISSIGKEILTDVNEGVPGVIRYGSRDTTREIQLKFYIDAGVPERFQWLRNQLFAILHDPLYLVEDAMPDRRFLVELPNTFRPERFGRNSTDGELNISVTTVDLPYAESKNSKEVNGTSIYVDGNVGIEPYHQELKFSIKNIAGSNEFLELKNTANDSHFRINEAVQSSSTVEIEGVMVKINNAQGLRRTDKQFIVLSPGMNTLELNGATSADITTIFRNYYR